MKKKDEKSNNSRIREEILNDKFFKTCVDLAWIFIILGGIFFAFAYIYACSALPTMAISDALNLSNTTPMLNYDKLSVKLLTHTTEATNQLLISGIITFLAGLTVPAIRICKNRKKKKGVS